MIKKSSTNFYKGRRGYKPEIIVLHIMDGSLIDTDSWFASPSSQASSHYGVGFNGEIHQYVEEEDSAWTQGKVDRPSFKLYKPNVNPNLYCLSIEHEGKDLSIVHEAQINATIELIKEMAGRWFIPIDRDHIIGHYQIGAYKPNCPATNKSIIDMIVRRCNETEELVTIQVPKSKLEKIKKFLLSI